MTAFEIIYILQVPLLFLAATIVGSMLIVEIIERKEKKNGKKKPQELQLHKAKRKIFINLIIPQMEVEINETRANR